MQQAAAADSSPSADRQAFPSGRSRLPDYLLLLLVLLLLRSFITPPGHGFLPRETALHHQEWAVRLVQQALQEAGVTPQQIGCIAFTKVGLPACPCLAAPSWLPGFFLSKAGSGVPGAAAQRAAEHKAAH